MEQPALRTWVSSHSVVERSGLPLYSDDRYIRAQARRDGIPSFGTVALLETIAERGQINQDVLKSAKRRLRASGALGIPLSEEDLIDEARGADWHLTESLRTELFDPATWRDINSALSKHLALLRAVFEGDARKLNDWVVRVLDALRVSHPEQTLATLAWIFVASALTSEEPPLVQALIRALPTASTVLAPLGDPVLKAFDFMMTFGEGHPGPFRLALLAHVLRKLDHDDRVRLMQRVKFTSSG